jgi:hypothetical protein
MAEFFFDHPNLPNAAPSAAAAARAPHSQENMIRLRDEEDEEMPNDRKRSRKDPIVLSIDILVSNIFPFLNPK